jgi:hypothetical protein
MRFKKIPSGHEPVPGPAIIGASGKFSEDSLRVWVGRSGSALKMKPGHRSLAM